MKRLLVIAVVCLPFISSAQIEKGKSFVSGGVGFTTYNPKDPQPGATKNLSQFDVDAMYGYLVGNTWAIGINPSYSGQIQTLSDDSKAHNNSFTVGPFIRKYFHLADKFYFHLDGGYSYSQQKYFVKSSQGDKGAVTKSTNSLIGITPGVSYFVSDRVALQATIGKLAYNVFHSSGNSASTFNLNFRISSISLGAAVYF